MNRQIFTVSQVNKYVKRTLESDPLLSDIFIEGELSNFNAHSSGHLYFTLKDATGAISGVMFKSHTYDLNFTPQSGMKVIAFGQIALYEKTGQYQLYAEIFEPAGIGGLELQFRQLKEALHNEGLFDEGEKKPIPQFAKRVAIITSPTGAAIQDMIRTIKNRNPAIQIVVLPAKVQGEGAATEISLRIKDAHKLLPLPDVIILGRGGGSVEDLWAFNEEILARSIFSAKIPIISAVGHETDFTIADFVADLRAATPTGAAVAASYDHGQVSGYLQAMARDLQGHMMDTIAGKRQDLARGHQQLNRQIKQLLHNKTQELHQKQDLLEKVSPYAMFKRGYALVRSGIEKISSINQLEKNQRLALTFQDGMADVVVDNVQAAPATDTEIVRLSN